MNVAEWISIAAVFFTAIFAAGAVWNVRTMRKMRERNRNAD